MTNANIAIDQGTDLLRLGSFDGQDSVHFWRDVQVALSAAGSPAQLGFFDHFLGDALKDQWQTDLSTSSTIAINAQANGIARFATHTDNDANATLALGLHFTPANGIIVMQVGVKQVSAITARAVEVGLSDALSETAGQAFTSHDATPVAAANNAAIFGFMADDTLTSFSALSVNAAGTPQVTLGVEAASTDLSHLTVVIDAAGNAYFFTGKATATSKPALVATHSLAVATDALLTPWVSITNQTVGTARTMDVDYVGVRGVAA